MAIPSQSLSAILDAISSTRIAFDKHEAGSRENLIDHSRALIAALEIPSEFIQRTFWAEVSNSSDPSRSIMLVKTTSKCISREELTKLV